MADFDVDEQAADGESPHWGDNAPNYGKLPDWGSRKSSVAMLADPEDPLFRLQQLGFERSLDPSDVLPQKGRSFGTIQQMGYPALPWTYELRPTGAVGPRSDTDSDYLKPVFAETSRGWLKPTDFSGTPAKLAN
ncbi:MAG TPA: hypothetical protein EYG03_10515 [Planctomycetes bacterium]|nr:hypothetical protein [Fuerstiella sp.]HIK92400.1 hypothetical protein [Planctomycetota bacterium]